ncbi:hypothetical protein TTHERM_00497410 (macronuclear) [Tetrahymena thermophila SB210]|uniref:Transmembrane protein n=1 Tax=Tetrahymena thermophila (strain SB210) TaxID=312017 RepID=I7LY47_TETTS|nr:hypothetical protein TTHERM_00497410 [Tetrahymena thermophila SB210]EAS07688.1 hypothetical protein TTHERM_00497410 [Tetrahymena thermophila SB210]|eukprot:XP_001027930.1 hypothetical protein TTHERM_00497410 [Tetrahymena thermophila SB210]
MRKTLIVAITILLISCVSSSKIEPLQGNLLRCTVDVAKAAQTLGNAIKSAVAQDWVSFAKGLISLAEQIKPMVEDCKDPICLGPATQRCQQKEQKQCEQWGAIEYPVCNEGYHNFGCCICAESCPSRYEDQGLYCKKPSSYGRGAGYPWEFGDDMSLNNAYKRCEAENSQGCEQYGLVIYPKCAEGFHNVGCCICSPDCPENYTDIGISCKKPSYGRGVGYPMYWTDCPNSAMNLEQKLRKESRMLEAKFGDLNCDELITAIKSNGQIFVDGNDSQNINNSVEVAPTISQLSAQYLDRCADMDKIDIDN